jgi:hypothetical protein
MRDNDLPVPPKSACLACPYHDNSYFRNLRDNSPDEWQDVVEFDEAIRKGDKRLNNVYVHRNLQPIGETDLGELQGDMFGNECDGYCGV